jgi:hypothetical protein
LKKNRSAAGNPIERIHDICILWARMFRWTRRVFAMEFGRSADKVEARDAPAGLNAGVMRQPGRPTPQNVAETSRVLAERTQ